MRPIRGTARTGRQQPRIPLGSESNVSHLTSEELGAYLSRAVHGAARGRVEAHLEGCSECRAELVEVSGLWAGARRQRRGRMAAAGGIGALAAALAGVLLLGPRADTVLPDREPRLRDGGRALDEGVARFETLTPGDGSTIESLAGSLLVWRPVAPGAFYSLTVTDERGDLVWSGSTADTVLRLPAELEVEPGNRYFWFVEALLTDGTTATTDASRLWVQP